MASPINKLIGANLRQHASRYVSTAIAVTIASTFVVLALTLMGGISQQYMSGLEDGTRGTAVIIRDGLVGEYDSSADEVPTPDPSKHDTYRNEVIQAVKALPEVADVVPSTATVQDQGSEDSLGYSSSLSMQITKGDNQTLSSLVYPQSAPLATPQYSQGSTPRAKNEIAINANAADSLGAHIGDTVSVRSMGTDKGTEFKVSGIIATSRLTSTESRVAVVTQEGALSVNPYGLTSSLKVIPRQSSLESPRASADSQKELTDKINQTISFINDEAKASGYEFSAYASQRFVDAGRKTGQTQLTTMTGATMMFPLIAAFVAAIIVGTTFQVIALQRRRELALLRAVGAQSKQVRTLIFRETSLAGIISAFIGSAIGSLLGGALLLYLGIAATYPLAMTMLPWGAILATWIVASLITIVVGVTPARRASAVSPLAALSPVQSVQEERRSHRIRVIIAIILLVLGIAGIAYGLSLPAEEQSQIYVRFGLVFVSTLVSWIAAMMIFSVALPHIIYYAGAIIRTPVGRLARGNVLRNPSRTASTGIAVIIGVVLMSTISVGVASVQATIDSHLSKVYPIDIEVTTQDDALSTKQANALLKFKHAEKAQAAYTTKAIVNGSAQDMIAVIGVPDLSDVARSKVNPIESGTAHMSSGTDLISQKSINVCYLPQDVDPTAVNVKNLTCQDLKVVKDDSVTAGAIEVNINDFTAAVPDARTGAVYMRIKDGTPFDQVLTDLQKMGSNLIMNGGYIERNIYMTALQVIVTVFMVLLGVSVIISLVGVANTLGLSVAERTQENGLLRALGLSRGQMRRLLVLESFLTSVVSTLVGIALGIVFAIIGMHTLPLGSLSAGIQIALPYDQLGMLLAVIVLASMLAAWLPGRQASKVSPVEALAHE
ncbi:ABC transporter permease [Alloscardovia theropitheci]|uniref:ABC transporter permease n=1 Tax=Alloscardovia theropitheci TaxID=2496842 RepID=A0A4R0QV16_9BIFI|nr:ABC transporter permease [Alloscardovia theropitheci]TCD53947.1 ABC transporter permease [Alloscardovia theropitheci]